MEVTTVDTYCRSCKTSNPVNGTKKYTNRDLCEICASTNIGNATSYRNQYENVALFETIGQVANFLRKDIRGLNL